MDARQHRRVSSGRGELVQARVTDDGVIYYDFMRRLTGEDVQAYAYQFGVVFWNLPFFVVFQGFQLATGENAIAGQPIGVVSVSAASTAAVVAIYYVSWRLLSELGLPRAPGAILLTVLGSPLFYYATFQPSLQARVRCAPGDDPRVAHAARECQPSLHAPQR